MTGANAAGMALQMINSAWTEDRQYRKQRKLMDKSVNQSKELSEFNRGQQMRLWEDTNYDAQMKQIAKAGLSEGLIYGQGGQGGTVAADNAQASAPTAPMGVTPETSAMGLQAAQTEALQAAANKSNAEAESIKGVGTEKTTAEIENIKQDTNNKKANEELAKADKTLKEIQTYVQGNTANASIQEINAKSETAIQHLRTAKAEANMSEEAYQANLKIVQNNAIKSGVEIELAKANVSKTISEKLLNDQKVQESIKTLIQNEKRLSQEEQKIAIEKFKKEFEANHPGASQVFGNALQSIMSDLRGLFNETEEYEQKQKKVPNGW